jgi:pimeloyl-ACP methyl ester carboxylesterase
MDLPETRYAKSGDVNIAYQVSGSGPFDLVWVQGYVNNVELHWELPGAAQFINRLSSFCRLIRFDRRGTGLSDRNVDPGTTLEQRMDDVRAVMDAAGSQRAALLGLSEGGPMSVMFAATYPERTRALVLYAAYAQTVEHPFGTLKAWMGATHFLTRTLDKVRTEMSLHVLAYNLKRMITIFGVAPLMAAIRT